MSTTADTSKSDEQSGTTEGSALYYALLYVETLSSSQALETLKFIQTLSSTLNDVTEGDVAEKKIHWWHEELTRLSKQQARHPASIEVQKFLNSHVSIEACLAILSAAASERYNSFATEKELNETIRADYGARLNLLEIAINTKPIAPAKTKEHLSEKPVRFQKLPELLNSSDDALTSSSTDIMALGFGQFDRLNSLAKRLRCGYSVFSDERYQEYGLTPEELVNHAMQPSQVQHKIQALIHSAVIDTLTSFESAENCIAQTRTTTSTPLPVQILCQIRHAQLKLWKKRKPNLLNESVTLTPLRKFIIAYRCKRRFEHR